LYERAYIIDSHTQGKVDDMLHGMKLYGATTVGQRGQVVLPADLRNERGIEPGDKLLVLMHEEGGPVLLVDANSVTLMLEQTGEALEKISKEVAKTKEPNK
jgi:AbrB family looped-hinge helix DNA binding protein